MKEDIIIKTKRRLQDSLKRKKRKRRADGEIGDWRIAL
jgi:hypothetical protein